jgi:hypothetical protein
VDRRAFLANFATAGFVILACLFTFRLVRMFHGFEGFSEYASILRNPQILTYPKQASAFVADDVLAKENASHTNKSTR